MQIYMKNSITQYLLSTIVSLLIFYLFYIIISISSPYPMKRTIKNKNNKAITVPNLKIKNIQLLKLNVFI